VRQVQGGFSVAHAVDEQGWAGDKTAAPVISRSSGRKRTKPRPTASLAAPPASKTKFGKPAGRIPVDQRVDPGLAALLPINKYGEAPSKGKRVFHLTAATLSAFRALRTQAAADGIDREMLTLTSAYRSADRQAELAKQARNQYGAGAGKWVAQDRSEHITGCAFDVNLGIENSSANARAGNFASIPAYRWLVANAGDFGLNAYAAEPWHWSYNVS
jgi:hypothetical protein